MDNVLERLNSQVVDAEEGPFYVLYAFIPVFHFRRDCPNIKKILRKPELLKKLSNKLIKFDIAYFKTLEDLFSSNIVNSCSKCMNPTRRRFKIFINDRIYNFALKKSDLKLIELLYNHQYNTIKELIEENKNHPDPEIRRLTKATEHKLARLGRMGLKENKKPKLSLLGKIVYFYNLYLEQNKNKKENIYI